MFEFSRSFIVIATLCAYLNFLKKSNNPFQMQMPNYFDYLSIFVDACENLVMVDDVATPLNPPVALVEKEELKETSLDVNVFQWSCKEEPSRRMVRTRADCLAWDRQLSPYLHVLVIYL
jgi:hypothetical protein